MKQLPWRNSGGSLFLLTTCLGLLLTIPGASQPPAGSRDSGPGPRVVRVTPPEANGAVEVSVAINPTNPDHLVAVSIARRKDHPGITNFAYVSTDAGRTWNMVPRANPHQTQQGDDVVTFTPDGRAVHAFISFAGIRQARPRRAHSGIVTSTSRDGVTWNAQVPVIELFNSAHPHEDKPWITADRSADSPHKGNLYVAWTRFDVYGSRSTRATFTFPARAMPASRSPWGTRSRTTPAMPRTRATRSWGRVPAWDRAEKFMSSGPAPRVCSSSARPTAA
jgi:hypothetical protein